MIDKLIEKYKDYTNNIIHNSEIINKMTKAELNLYDKDIAKSFTKLDCFQEILKDLEELKQNINQTIMSKWDGTSYMNSQLKDKVSEVNLTKIIKDLEVDIDE